jgi:nitroimidazol reductase NimA-like FMN-containing flavoprotein (pyridoxamine 5'-phosphate oxidase superfamily)
MWATVPDQTTGSPASDPGDLGRRITRRREELGLSPEEVALRAGMAPGYVEYLERQPTGLTESELLRLANALDSTVRALLGAGFDLPPGQHDAADDPELIELDRGQSRALLGTHGVGRVGLFTESGPLIVPVNYAVVDDAIVFRTAAGTVLATETAEGGIQVAFEVDHVDEANRQGWAVLVTGQARTVTEPAELRHIADQAHVQPWAGGQRDICVRVDPQRITGRRILTH